MYLHPPYPNGFSTALAGKSRSLAPLSRNNFIAIFSPGLTRRSWDKVTHFYTCTLIFNPVPEVCCLHAMHCLALLEHCTVQAAGSDEEK